MAKLISYSCSKCAGVLTFDEGLALFECPFCGNEFNIVELHREELAEQAESALKRLKFETAKEKYKAMLSKNPRDFEALLGMILAAGKISSADDLKNLDKVKNYDPAPAKHALRDAKIASEENADYFEKLTLLFKLADDYKAHWHERDERTQNARNSFRDIAEKEAEINMEKELEKDRLKSIATDMPMFAALVWIWVYLIKCFNLEKEKESYRESNEKIMANDHLRAKEMSDKAVEIRNKYKKVYCELKALDPTVNGYTPPAASKVDAGSDPFADIVKNVNCAKCGGQLILDKEKRLYECTFCGVGYGASLFFNDPLAKARHAITLADYSEADQRFSYMLMVDPQDLDALLGRIFCAGKWRSINDIDLEDKMLPLMEEHLKDRTCEAVSHSSEAHKQFFSDMQKIVNCYIDYTNNDKTIKSALNNYNYAREKSGMSFSDQPDEDLKKKKEQLDELVSECKAKRRKYRDEFDELKGSLKDQYASLRQETAKTE